MMKKGKTRSLGDLLEPLWSSRDNMTKSSKPDAIPVKGKRKFRKNKNAKKNEEVEDFGSVFHPNELSKNRAATYDHSTPNSSDTESVNLINKDRRLSHSPVSKSFSLGDMLMRKSKKCDSRPRRPSYLSLKTSTSTSTTTTLPDFSKLRQQRYKNLNNNCFSCDDMNNNTNDSTMDIHQHTSTGNSTSPWKSTEAFTMLEVGPTLRFPSAQSVTKKDISTQNNNGSQHLPPIQHKEKKSASNHSLSNPITETERRPLTLSDDVTPKRPRTHRERRKTFRTSKSIDIVSQDSDVTNSNLDVNKDLNKYKTKPGDAPKVEWYLNQTKTKMIVSHSCDDFLNLDKSTNAMETYSNTEKDYLKVPQRGQSVDYSLLACDLQKPEKKHRFRTFSNAYIADEVGDTIEDSHFCSSMNDLPLGNTNSRSLNKSRSPSRSQTFNLKSERKASFVISPTDDGSPPPCPFTFDLTSRRSLPPNSEPKSPIHVSHSLDMSASGSSPPSHSKTDNYSRTCQSAEIKLNTDPKKSKKPPRSQPISYPRLLSEAVSPTCESCSPPSNRIFNRLARRFSLRRKPSKDKNKKSGSVDDLLKYSFGVGDISRKSLESDTSMSVSNTENTTDSDKSSLQDIEHETLYRGVIRCLLHPLGYPGTAVGLRPGDLLDHVRLVFDVPCPDHAFYIREERQNVPTKVQASVTLLEAKNLTWTGDHGGIYCLITQVIPGKAHTTTTITANCSNNSAITNTKLSPKNSPRCSPKTSPRSSPKFAKSLTTSPSLEVDLLRSHTCTNTHDPKWNECFHIDLDDPSIDEITIFVCYYDSNTPHIDTAKQPEKGNALKSFFRNILQAGHDNDKGIPGCFGRVDLPIREIPTEGCDNWLNILPIGSSSKQKPVGQLRLQVAVSSKHATVNNYFCAEDYHQASLLVHKHAADAILDADGLDLSITPAAQKILNIFAVANGISKLSQKIMNLTVYLELVFSRYSHTVTDSVLHRAMEDVQMTWCEMQVRGGGDFLQKMPLCDAEICLYRTATRRYIDAIIDRLTEMPVLFPPSMDTIHNMKAHFGIGLHLLELDVWDAITSPQRDLAGALVKKLQNDVREWMDSNLDSIHLQHGPVKDAVIPEVEELANVTNALVSILTPLGVVEQFFLGVDVKYYRIVYFETERKLSLKVREIMMNLDKYQKRYQNYRVNLNRSCRLSIKLFLAVRSYYHTVKDAFDDRDLFRLSITLYQDWFQEAVVFWLQMFRTECTSRIQKALEIDKDLVLVTSQLKYSNSSVDAQACFSEITLEWRQIDIKDADMAVMGVTKIVDMICDGARVYASKIHRALERNCYYDCHLTQFDVAERMCITLNNIEHVRMYLSELPELLEIEEVTKRLELKHEAQEIGLKSLDTLYRLIQNADMDILQMSSGILRKVCQKMSVEVKHNMDKFLVKTPELSTATDISIAYLNTNLETLKLQLSETIFPHMASQLWVMVAQLFDEHVLVGKSPDYYIHMQQHLRALTMFFLGWCPSQSDPFVNLNNNPLLEALKERLEISSWKTDCLMREYLHNLSSHMSTPLEYLGHLAVKAAYMEETRGNVTLYVKVIQGIDLPGLDSSGLSDPYVIVSVQPQEIFGQPGQRTKVIGQTLQPVFNTTFMFPNIPRECLTERGNCLLLSVMDQDVVTQDDFAGEVVISLDSIVPITMNQSVDIAPALLMPLKRPQVEKDGPFKVLRERVGWDKSAKKFIKSRMRYIENQPERTDNSVRERLSGFFSFWNKLLAPKNESAVT